MPRTAWIGVALGTAFLGVVLAGSTGVSPDLNPIQTAYAQEEEPIPRVELDFSEAGREDGKKVFEGICQGCHGLKFLRDRATGRPIQAKIEAKAAEASFGKVPPDLSLITKSRRGGATYVYALLTGYEEEPRGCTTAGGRNRFFPGGCIAMPNLGITKEQAEDVAVYLDSVADPSKDLRETVGVYVLSFMAVFTLISYVLYRRVWAAEKGRL